MRDVALDCCRSGVTRASVESGERKQGNRGRSESQSPHSGVTPRNSQTKLNIHSFVDLTLYAVESALFSRVEGILVRAFPISAGKVHRAGYFVLPQRLRQDFVASVADHITPEMVI